MDCTDPAQDTNQWRALVNMVMNLRVPYNVWELLEWLRDWRLLKKFTTPRSYLNGVNNGKISQTGVPDDDFQVLTCLLLSVVPSTMLYMSQIAWHRMGNES
jgi:hypothetical protein